MFVRLDHVARLIINANHSIVWTSEELGKALLLAACGARVVSAACGGFRFARNTPTAFDVFYWLQVTNIDVSLFDPAPSGSDYIDILRLCLHVALPRNNVRLWMAG